MGDLVFKESEAFLSSFSIGLLFETSSDFLDFQVEVFKVVSLFELVEQTLYPCLKFCLQLGQFSPAEPCSFLFFFMETCDISFGSVDSWQFFRVLFITETLLAANKVFLQSQYFELKLVDSLNQVIIA